MTVTPIEYDPGILLGHRVETFWTVVMDSDDNPQGILRGVSNGSVSHNIDAAIRGGYQFTLTTALVEFDWMQVRFQPWVKVNGVSWPLGVYLPSSPDLMRTATVSSLDVSAHDKTIILDQDKIVQTYSLPEGTPVVAEVVALIQGAGETALAVTPSDAVTRVAMTWPVATPVRKIVNDLLVHINYSSIWADGYGQFRIQPHFEPREREPVHTFRAGADAIHKGTWKRSQDFASVPNRVVLTTSGTDEVEELVSVASNANPSSPYSYQRRGNRWVTRPYENVDAADQVTLDALAQRYLANATRAVANISIDHAVIPIEPGSVVRFVSGPLDVLAQIKEYTIGLKAGALVNATLTEVDIYHDDQ